MERKPEMRSGDARAPHDGIAAIHGVQVKHHFLR
jgi:hypothetical protein